MGDTMTSVTPIKQQQPPANATRGRMALHRVTTGRLDQPDRFLVVGQEGVGKTTLFSDPSIKPIFLCSEDGTGHVDVARFPEPQSFDDVLEAVRTLIEDQHDFETLVFDTVDWLEPLVWAHVCAAAKKTDIESFGYGKGYVAALDEWRRLLAELDRLRAVKRMRIAMLAHAHIKTFRNPEGEDFDRFTGKLHDKSFGLLKEWADHVLFARFQVYTVEKDGRTKGISDGARVLCTTRTAAYDAKNRADLPAELPLSWTDLAAALAKRAPADPARLEAECTDLLVKLGDMDTTTKANEYLTTHRGNAAKLAHLVNRLRALVAEKEKQS